MQASLTGNGTISVTSSILNLTGHKDEALCRRLAEKLCRETGRVVVCTGGFHIDNMKPEQIDEVVKALDGWRMRLCRGLLGQDTAPYQQDFNKIMGRKSVVWIFLPINCCIAIKRIWL